MRSILQSFILCIITSSVILVTYNVIGNPNIKMNKETKEKLEKILYLELKTGRVTIQMLPEVAPNHVEQIKMLCRKKFYDGLTFHRVIDNFMAQGGDPLGNGTGGYSKKIPAEFSTLAHKRGAVSMARSSDPNSASSQFFIVTEDSPFLDGQYTIWGYVKDGMEHVDKIKKGDQRLNGAVEDPDKIISMRVALDVEVENIKKA